MSCHLRKQMTEGRVLMLVALTSPSRALRATPPLAGEDEYLSEASEEGFNFAFTDSFHLNRLQPRCGAARHVHFALGHA